ncbi:Integrin-alpha FG-GAP repeat-containing protein 2 [Liparis tanakae]|uniref:Integrin-alpha FG-GAP repeat-containing protein 2 n=1 Tax=Liparis tanakae TaxID=230148 RepID=A0A4Z2FBV0_9TELE|nr:Integrin-alpha FG-GAP repeat-containing protein 2 [Liparis tanakae]
MRSLNYVQRVSLDFPGTLFPHAICLGDADNDSLNELVVGDTNGKLLVYKNDESRPWVTRSCVGMLVVGYTDRVVRAFRWEEPADGAEPGSGQLVLLKKWLLEGQVDSLTVNPGPEGLPELMVSQPGCGYAILLCSWTQHDSSGSGEEALPTSGSEGPSRDVVLHLTTGRIHNKNVSTHLIGSISKGSREESSTCGLFALCTLDGTLSLHHLIGYGDGREEVVACAWDGQTYIIDHNRTVVRFQFDENVNAFCAGQYTCKDGKNSPCLVYVSFNHKIYIYWKVQLERMESTNMLRVLEEKPEFSSHLKALGVGPGVKTRAVKEAPVAPGGLWSLLSPAELFKDQVLWGNQDLDQDLDQDLVLLAPRATAVPADGGYWSSAPAMGINMRPSKSPSGAPPTTSLSHDIRHSTPPPPSVG